MWHTQPFGTEAAPSVPGTVCISNSEAKSLSDIVVSMAQPFGTEAAPRPGLSGLRLRLLYNHRADLSSAKLSEREVEPLASAPHNVYRYFRK